ANPISAPLARDLRPALVSTFAIEVRGILTNDPRSGVTKMLTSSEPASPPTIRVSCPKVIRMRAGGSRVLGCVATTVERQITHDANASRRHIDDSPYCRRFLMRRSTLAARGRIRSTGCETRRHAPQRHRDTENL